jgi:cell wall-associated protease
MKRITKLLPLTLLIAMSAQAKLSYIPKIQAQMDAEFSANKLENTFIFNKTIKGDIKGNTNFLGDTPTNWFNLDPETDEVQGVSAEKVYSDFGQPNSEDIIVAVIDSGVDVNHEDLQGKIWINEGEVPNDGIDNDENGYIDDVFGWNFIGGADGMAKMVKTDKLENGLKLKKGKKSAQVDADTLEVTRELVRLKKLKSRRSLNKTEAALLIKVAAEVKSNRAKNVPVYRQYSLGLEKFQKAVKTLRLRGFFFKPLTIDKLETAKIITEKGKEAQKFIISELKAKRDENYYQVRVDYFGSMVNFYYNEDFNPRTVVGDDYSDQTEKFYGNNDVIGPDSSHGTHVSGIIAAARDNKIGINGVAENVKIMAIRCVPNGDERDKDVANSIRYAVDNGAKIINMSFGKGFSPYKSVVDAAVKYAESKGVLLVHAAGNSNQDNDSTANFPNKRMNETTPVNNWLEIGASSYKKGANLPADFSNYGQNQVDLFAPGVDLLSTTPDNKYDTYSGTSMASPAAAGVAALILSFRNNLKANELHSLIMATSVKFPLLNVKLPGTTNLVLFSTLSRNGGVANAYNAISVIQK